MTEHRHQSNLQIAADHLVNAGRISAMVAIYDGVCECGARKRNTRLAATISNLRHVYGWDIRTEQKPGKLAEYVLVNKGRALGKEKPVEVVAPPVPTRPSANRKPRVTPADVPVAQRLYCPHCTDEVKASGQHLLGGYRETWCDQCNKTVLGQPWKPAQGVDNVPTRMHVGRGSQAKTTYKR